MSRNVKGRASVLTILAVSTLFASQVRAYCLTNLNAPWSRPGTAKTMALSTFFPSTMRSVLAAAMQQWNMAGSVLIYNTPVYVSNWASQPFNGQFVSFTSIGQPDTLPAYSSGMASTTTHANGAVALNSNFAWSNGTHNIFLQQADTATVVVHEIGHLNGLTHPTVCYTPPVVPTAAEQASVMTVVNTGTRQYLNSDDIAYQKWRY